MGSPWLCSALLLSNELSPLLSLKCWVCWNESFLFHVYNQMLWNACYTNPQNAQTSRGNCLSVLFQLCSFQRTILDTAGIKASARTTFFFWYSIWNVRLLCWSLWLLSKSLEVLVLWFLYINMIPYSKFCFLLLRSNRALINVWIPSVFLRGKAANAFHVYQVSDTA